jgi:hypothetical protein
MAWSFFHAYDRSTVLAQADHRACRPRIARCAFAPARTIQAIRGYVEAPTISGDGKALYYHQKIDSTFRIFRASRR